MKTIQITGTEMKMGRIRNKFTDVFEIFDQENLDQPDREVLLKEKVLKVSKTWPIRASVGYFGSDSCNDWVYILKSNYPGSYLHLFELIFNSLLAKFYLERKYQLGEEDHLTIDLQYINNFPVFDLEYDYGVPDEIFETERLVQSQLCDSPEYKKLQEKLENLIFTLYGLIYYDLKEVEHYYIEKERKDSIFTEDVIAKYCEEYIDTLHSFVRDKYVLKPEWVAVGSKIMVRFSLSRKVVPLQYNKDIEKFIPTVENSGTKYETEGVFEKRRVVLMGYKCICILKSNRMRDWTQFMAIRDSNQVLHKFFNSLK